MSRWIPLVLVGACCPPEPAKKVTVSTVQQPSAKPELRELAVDGEVRLKNLASSAATASRYCADQPVDFCNRRVSDLLNERSNLRASFCLGRNVCASEIANFAFSNQICG
jgi:hypothetical protein